MFRSSRQLQSRFRPAARLVAGCLAVIMALHVQVRPAAQEELTRPPRIIEATEDPPPPGAENPTPADTAQAPATALEEIVVISDRNPWRLPDPGSQWRAQQEEERDTGRISADLLPLWNPDEQEIPTRNPFAVTDDFSRVGFIEVFRVRFGRR